MEQSCLYTAATLYEWMKSLRFWRAFFVVIPIVLSGVATWPLLTRQGEYKWVTGACALMAGVFPAIYKALDFDVNLKGVAEHARVAKILQDRFRQAWNLTALGPFDEFKTEFDNLMERRDAARASSFIHPERFYRKAHKKIVAGDYEYTIDEKKPMVQSPVKCEGTLDVNSKSNPL